MEVEVNMWGVVLAAVAAMVIGSVWYSPAMFYKQWQQMAKVPELKGDEGKKAAMRSMVIAAVLSLLTAYVVAHVTYLSQSFYGVSFQQAGITTGFWLWLGVAMTQGVTGAVFELRPPKLIALNAANQLVTLVAMGLIIGAVGV